MELSKQSVFHRPSGPDLGFGNSRFSAKYSRESLRELLKWVMKKADLAPALLGTKCSQPFSSPCHENGAYAALLTSAMLTS